MSNEQEERVPGITFRLEKSSVFGRDPVRGVEFIGLELRCEVADSSLWNEVEKKFKDGLRVFTDDDFHTSVMSAMREKIEELEREVKQLRAGKELLAKDNARLENEAKKYKEPLEGLGRALGR